MTPGRWRTKPKFPWSLLWVSLLLVGSATAVLVVFREAKSATLLFVALKLCTTLCTLALAVEAVSHRIRRFREPVAEDELLVTAELCRTGWWTPRYASGKLFWEDDRLVFHADDVSLAIGSGDVQRVRFKEGKLRVSLRDGAGVTFSNPGRGGPTMLRMYETWLRDAPPATSPGESVPLTRR